MAYLDGFLLVVKKDKLAEYKKLSTKAGKIWKEHGALQYIEASGDDLVIKGMKSDFNKVAKAKPGELVVFSFILYKSKAERNRINKLVMADPRLQSMMDPKKMPFDMKRMTMGGFKTFVEL